MTSRGRGGQLICSSGAGREAHWAAGGRREQAKRSAAKCRPNGGAAIARLQDGAGKALPHTLTHTRKHTVLQADDCGGECQGVAGVEDDGSSDNNTTTTQEAEQAAGGLYVEKLDWVLGSGPFARSDVRGRLAQAGRRQLTTRA